MSTVDVLAELLRLPAEERARLALELIRSVDAGSETGAAGAWDLEIARRGAEVDAGLADTMTNRRVTVLDRFPFRIPYQVADAAIVVLPLAHVSRGPDYWARRAITI